MENKILIQEYKNNSIKEITATELPQGSVISGFFTGGRIFGEIEKFKELNDEPIICWGRQIPIFPKDLEKMGRWIPEHFVHVISLSEIEIYHIPGYQKMWIATDYCKECYLYASYPDRVNEVGYYAGHTQSLIQNNFGQTWDDEPWSVWVKL